MTRDAYPDCLIDLDTLKALEQAATPAPWKADTETRGDCVLWGPDGQFVANAQAEPHWLPAADGGKRAVMFDVDRRDAALIAAMRNALPALLDELAAVTADRDGYREMFGKLDAATVQIEQERDAAREELAKVRAELDEAKAEQGRIAQRMAAALEPYVSPSAIRQALADADANPATTAEPAATVCGRFPDGHDLIDAATGRIQPCPTCGPCPYPDEAEPDAEPKATCGAICPDITTITCTMPPEHPPVPVMVNGDEFPLAHFSKPYATAWNPGTALIHDATPAQVRP